MKLHPASRLALQASRARLDQALTGNGHDPSRTGEDLFAFASLLIREPVIRRALADASTEADHRVQLTRRLLTGKIAEESLQVIDVVVAERWSNTWELIDGVEELASAALLTAAHRAGALDRVETELFQIARLIGANGDLELALTEDGNRVEPKRRIVERLFTGKVHPVTEALVEHAVTHPRGHFAETQIDILSDRAARLRERSVAHVTSAGPLTDSQREQLADKLTRLFARPITVHVDVQPKVLGGIQVRVGDEVIDGTSAGRLAAARGVLVR